MAIAASSPEARPPDPIGRRGQPRLRTLFLLGALLPLLGVLAVAVGLLANRLADRASSSDLADQAAEMGEVAEVRRVVAEEEVRSTAVAIARVAGVDPATEPRLAELADPEALAAARAAVDAAIPPRELRALPVILHDLDELREQLDRGEASYEDVTSVFARLNDSVASRWSRLVGEVEQAADRRPVSREIRARLRALRETVDAFLSGDQRIRSALALVSPADETEAAVERTRQDFIDSTARFDVSAERATASLGPKGGAAWSAFRSDAAARHTEALLDGALEAVHAGEPTSFGADVAEVAANIEAGGRWAILLADLVGGTSADMEDSARDEEARQTRLAIATAVGTSLLAAASLTVAVIVSRRLIRPANELERAARQVEQGDFDLAPIPPGGSRELSAAVVAFNDMAATLAAVEDHAVALAEDPEAPLLARRLPGRTGQALQAALDHLRGSIRLAEQRRTELEQLASHDGLTGLLNRRAAFEAIERDLARAERDGSELMALYLDLDGLKAVNDTFGHDAGDEAIRCTASVLSASTRKGDVVARLGGDEFLVAGPVPAGTGGQELADAMAARVHAAITEAELQLDDGTVVPLRASVGVATSHPGETVEELLKRADTALYAAKRGGRDRIAWAEGTADGGD